MKISNQDRKRLNQERRLILKQSLLFERRLIRLRTNEINRVLKLLKKTPIEDWLDKADSLNEDYLKKYLLTLYKEVGYKVGERAVRAFIGVKKATSWQDEFNKWANEQAGKNIKIIESTFKEWFLGVLKKELTGEYANAGVEKLTREVFKSVMSEWEGVKRWQVRRIVRTETMTASSVAGFDSVKSLGIPFTKVWVTSGLPNTRDIHAEADGQEVDEDEMFIVGGEELMYPRDPNAGASARNIVNCACSHLAKPKK